MSSNSIRALVQRHAGVERQIEDVLKSPAAYTLHIMTLRKLRLACRDRIREAIRETQTQASARRQKHRRSASFNAAKSLLKNRATCFNGVQGELKSCFVYGPDIRDHEIRVAAPLQITWRPGTQVRIGRP